MNHSEPQFDPQHLVDEYFLRDFTEQEVHELNAVLAGNPSLKAQFMENMHDDLDLYEAMQHMQEERNLRKRAIVYSQSRSVHTIRLARMNRIAASLLFLLGAGLVYRVLIKSPSTDVAERMIPVAEVAEVAERVIPVAEVTDLFALDGDQVSARNSAERRSLHMGETLLEDDLVSVPKGGRLSLTYLSDSTTVSFEENSSFKILKSSGAKNLELHDGRMVADVAKQETGKPFRITTDDAELVVLGTRFELMNRKETILSVLSGNVQMNDLSSEDSVLVPAGYLAESDKGELSRPVEFWHEKLNPVSSRTLPGIPKQHKKAAKTHIIVDSERNLRGRVDFMIPRVKGRIRQATLRLRVVPFETDRGGGGTIRVKRADRKNASDMGQHSGRVKAGMDLIFNIDPSRLSEGKNQLLLEMDQGGNDFWFGAEGSTHPPELQLTIIND